MPLLNQWVSGAEFLGYDSVDRRGVFALLASVGEEAVAETLRDLGFFPGGDTA
jgi:hypothetical protein